MPALIPLSGMFPEELCETLQFSQPFRGRQVFSWIARGADSFDCMTNLDKATRARLAQTASLRSVRVHQVLRDADGTVKLQVVLADGRAVETVLLTDREGRRTACVSSQAGCAMGCAFCQTGQLGPGRNLTAGEIVEQFLFLEHEAGTLDNIVFMGMGEPLQNLGAVRKAVALLAHKDGRRLSVRRMTLSTCGLVQGIYDLADGGPAIRLAVSLTTADEDLRRQLMPVAAGNPLAELREAIAYYGSRTGQRVTLEAALLKEQNTSHESALRLRRFADGLDVFVNLIPWNPVPGLPFESPSAQECDRFARWLRELGLNVGLRTRRGSGIAGACGQLGRSQAEK